MAQVSEKELYLALINSLMVARDAMRGLGLMRNDETWIHQARAMDMMKDNVTKLMTQAQSRRSGIWVPPITTLHS